MKWRDDLPADWDRASDDPPVSADGLDPRLAAVGLHDLAVDRDEHC